jgi:hypothetical protein
MSIQIIDELIDNSKSAKLFKSIIDEGLPAIIEEKDYNVVNQLMMSNECRQPIWNPHRDIYILIRRKKR